MKILHTADVQLGAQFKTLGKKAPLQREQLKKTFHKMLETAVQEKAVAVLVCGDLFDSNHPVHELVEFVRGEIKYLSDNNVYLCIVPGHHDCLDEHGIYNRERLDDEFDNVFIFRNPEGEVKEYSDLDLAVFAKPNVASTSTKTSLPELAESSMRYKVFAAHGDLQIPGKSADNYHPIGVKELEGVNDIDYAALGHWHSMRDCSEYGSFDFPVWYCGSPELVAADQTGAGNVLLIDFSGENEKVKIKPIKLGKRVSSSLDVDIGSALSAEEIKGKIAELADKDLILRVSISGLNTNQILFNAEKLEEDLEDAFFHLKIKDSSHLALKEIPEYSDALIQGQFVKIMRKKIREADDSEKKIREDALQIGLMELGGKEII